MRKLFYIEPDIHLYQFHVTMDFEFFPMSHSEIFRTKGVNEEHAMEKLMRKFDDQQQKLKKQGMPSYKIISIKIDE